MFLTDRFLLKYFQSSVELHPHWIHKNDKNSVSNGIAKKGQMAMHTDPLIKLIKM